MANYVQFMRGSLAAYNLALENDKINDNTLYFLSDSINSEGWLYLGKRLISGPNEGFQPETFKLTDLSDVYIDDLVEYDSLLMFNTATNRWENWTFDELRFKGASSTVGGIGGLVPAPVAGQEKMFLRADGTWAEAGSRGKVFEVEPEKTPTKHETHEEAIIRIVSDNILNNGDIVIVRENLTNNKYQYTSYVYEDTKWVAMDGNYDAENVYFKSDLIFTEAVGTVTIPSTGSATVAAAGKNLKQVMESIFSQEKNPTITPPSINLTTNHTSYEVGSEIVPTYSFSLNPGTYEYGPATEVEALQYSIVISNKGETISTSQLANVPENGVIANPEDAASIVVEDDTNYYITATMTYTDGVIPVTNLNNYYYDGQIKSGSVPASSGALTGYRSYFYGMDDSTSTIDSDLIRTKLNNCGAYNGQKIFTLSAADLEGVKRFIIAVPASSTRSGLVSAIMTSSMNANATDDYKLLDEVIEVEGANGYSKTGYKVWVYAPASIANNEVHQITLS